MFRKFFEECPEWVFELFGNLSYGVLLLMIWSVTMIFRRFSRDELHYWFSSASVLFMVSGVLFCIAAVVQESWNGWIAVFAFFLGAAYFFPSEKKIARFFPSEEETGEADEEEDEKLELRDLSELQREEEERRNMRWW